MEIQVLKESCVDRFERFIAKLEQLTKSQATDLNMLSQSIKLIQLMKGRPNYRAIMENDEPSNLNLVDEEELLLYDVEGDYRHYKPVWS